MTLPLESSSGHTMAVKVYNPLDGSIVTHRAPASVTMGPYASLLVLDTGE